MFWSDFFEKNDQINFEEWFEKLNQSQIFDRWKIPYIDFFLKTKNYFNSKGIKLIIIWDQINVLYRTQSKIGEELIIYKTLTNNNLLFDHIILSSSNNNEEINMKDKNTKPLEINPFEVFNKSEFKNLVQVEIDLLNLIPSDINKENPSEYKKYISDLCEMLNFQICEYHCYKSMAWDDDFLCFKIKNKNFDTNREKYYRRRKAEIQNSEEKFREVYLKRASNLKDYYFTLKKIQVYNEKNNIFAEETVKN